MQTRPRQAIGGVNKQQQGVPFPALSKPEVLNEMRHYVVQNDRSDKAETFAPVSERIRHIDVIVRSGADKASAEIVKEFYRALNSLTENDTYIVNLRGLAEDIASKSPAALALYGPVEAAPTLEALQERRAA